MFLRELRGRFSNFRSCLLFFRQTRANETIFFATEEACPGIPAEIIHQVRTGRGNELLFWNPRNGRDIPDPDDFARHSKQLRTIQGEGYAGHWLAMGNARYFVYRSNIPKVDEARGAATSQQLAVGTERQRLGLPIEPERIPSLSEGCPLHFPQNDSILCAACGKPFPIAAERDGNNIS